MVASGAGGTLFVVGGITVKMAQFAQGSIYFESMLGFFNRRKQR
jgi:hypothetical protein